jgi:hypothetical protein
MTKRAFEKRHKIECGASRFGVDKEAVHMAATALYTALVMARH